jgi:hypothetical protein
MSQRPQSRSQDLKYQEGNIGKNPFGSDKYFLDKNSINHKRKRNLKFKTFSFSKELKERIGPKFRSFLIKGLYLR